MEILLYIAIFCLGTILGSYLNSWVWRVHNRQWSFGGRSKCVHCSRQLLWYENIPLISFLVLRGRCRTCKGQIPKSYFWTELATPLFLVLVSWYHAQLAVVSPWHYLRDVFATVFLLVIFLYDALYMEIPTSVVWGGSIVIAYLNYRFLGIGLSTMALGALVAVGFFGLQYAVSRGRWIGGGDVRLGVFMGTLLGYPLVVLAIGASYILGALVAVPLLIFKKKTMNSPVPFGTFLTVGTFGAMLFGYIVIEWYVGLVRW